MSFARIAAVSVAVSVMWCAAASAGGPVRPFKHGFWSGGAYVDDRTGAFTHCSAGVAYDSGINLFVLVTGGYRWWLGFINPKWSLTPNARLSIKLELDDGPPFNGLASIPSGQLLLVSLPDSSKLLAAFRRSSKLALDAEGQSFSFKLNGTPAVMDQLATCVRTSAALKTAAPSPSSSTAAAANIGAVSASSSGAPPAPSGSPAIAESGSVGAPVEGTPSAKPGPRPQAPEVPAATSPQDEAAAQTKTPTETARESPASPQRSQPEAAASANAMSGGAVSPPAMPSARSDGAAMSAPTAAASSTAPGSQASPAATATPPHAVASTAPEGERASDRPGRGPAAPISSASSQPTAPAAEKPEVAAQPPLSNSAAPPLAFTSVAPAASAPSTATAPELPPGLATATALEEIRLATDFLTNARLRDARLIVAEKPPALAEFAAVWRSEDAAGAVKIVPPGPDVSGIEIASNLIAVDPRVCKGDFSAARFRDDVGNSVVFSAILSCSEANEQRVTEYFITPRHRGGFVVFAVIRSKAVDKMPGFDWQKIDVLSKAAIQAAEGQG